MIKMRDEGASVKVVTVKMEKQDKIERCGEGTWELGKMAVGDGPALLV